MSEEPQSSPPVASERQEQLALLIAGYIRETEAGVGLCGCRKFDCAQSRTVQCNVMGDRSTKASTSWLSSAATKVRLDQLSTL